MDFHTRYAAYQAAIEQYLEGLFSTDKPYGRLQEAMRYSLLSGGKRIRPVLTLELARLGGIDWHLALPYACALELVHTYSLIHDDLPCMDDDDLRRGKPTCHKAYGETLAVLAGDALQPEAFRLIAEAPCMSAESRVEAIRVLSHAAGADGMVAGQVIDTLCGVSTQQELTGMYRLKTGVMISAAAELGCVASGMPAAMRQQAIAFADKLGLAFQIRTICWMWWATRLCSASPSVPIERRGRSPLWTCWGWKAAARPWRSVPAGPRRPSSRGRITTSY